MPFPKAAASTPGRGPGRGAGGSPVGPRQGHPEGPHHGAGLSIDTRPGPLHNRLIGQTPAMRDLFEAIAKLAVMECPVLLTGEPGTGKKTLARTMHELSPRKAGPFLSIGCDYFSSDFLLAELFGRAGQRPGLLETARGGVLFLDEVFSLSHEVQLRLDALLRTSRYRPMGAPDGTAPEIEAEADLRLVAASSLARGPLMRALERSPLREHFDQVLDAPPLSRRRGDIPLLSRYLVHRYAEELNRDVKHLSPEALERIKAHSFPGNILELESVIESAVITAEGDTILPEHLPEPLAAPQAQGLQEPSAEAPEDEAAAGHTGSEPGGELPSLAEMEAEHIRRVMQATGGNKNRAADILGISRSSLWRKLKRLEGEE